MKTEMDLVNICLVGCGTVSVPHLNAYEVIPRSRVVAVCDVVEAAARNRAKQFGVEDYYTNFEEALRDHEVDLVDVCVPTALHRSVTVDALAAGKNVLCEKPMAGTLQQCDEMIDAARRSGRQLMIGQSGRYAMVFAKARELLAAGDVGEVLYARVAHRYNNPALKWMNDPKNPKYYWEEGGGPLIDMGVHGADLLNLYFKTFPLCVYAEAASTPKDVPFWTVAHVVVEYDGGVGLLEIERATTDYPNYERGLELLGTRAFLEGFDNGYRAQLVPHSMRSEELYGGVPVEAEWELSARMPFQEALPFQGEIYLELLDMISALCEGREMPVLLEDSRRALELCVAAEMSARSGKPTELPLRG